MRKTHLALFALTLLLASGAAHARDSFSFSLSIGDYYPRHSRVYRDYDCAPRYIREDCGPRRYRTRVYEEVYVPRYRYRDYDCGDRYRDYGRRSYRHKRYRDRDCD